MSSHSCIELPQEYHTLRTGIALYDPASGMVIDANPRFESLLGYSICELREMSVDRYSANTYSFSASDFLERLQASANGTTEQFRWRIKRDDGELVWVRFSLARERFDGRVYVRAEVRNITNEYNTNHREELFWRILRHNLRNETAVLVGDSEQILLHSDDEEIRTAAEEIKTRALELGSITESVKQIQQAVTQTDDERVCRAATEAIQGMIDDLVTEYPDATINFHKRTQMWIHADSAFDHALRHAVENAIIHNSDPTPEVTVRLGPSPNTGRVEIRIEDSNSPIPAAELDGLFDRDGVTETSHGSGVGLFVMKWCVESLGGELTFERRGTSGNTVYFYLPPRSPSEQTT